MAEKCDLFIAGNWVPASSAQTIKVTNPCDLEEVVGYASVASSEDVDRAVKSAHEAWLDWRRRPAAERARIMHKAARAVEENTEELGELVRRELGRVISEAPAEVLATAGVLDYFAQEAFRLRGSVAQANERGKMVLILKEPVGVVAAIVPWNNPLYILGRIMAPALAAGCTVVCKPPSEAPLGALKLAEVLSQAGLPPGVLNVITGPGPETGEALITHPLVAKVSLTGGRDAGTRVMELAARGIKGVTLELGGQCPAIVCEDADVEAAAEAIKFQAFRQGGQVCNRVNRVYGHRHIYDVLRRELTARIAGLVVSDSADPNAHFAALINDELVKRSEEHVRDAVQKGAVVDTGGTRLTEGKFARGHYFAPTLVSNCTQDMRVMREETFGPVLALASFDHFDEALRLANDTVYGLSAFLFTKDMAKAFKGVEELQAGTLWVNDIHLTYTQCPYGGYKESGLGRSQGPEALQEYLETKTVYWDTQGKIREHGVGH